MSLAQLYDCCKIFPELLHVNHSTLTTYISLIRHLKPRIAFTQLSTSTSLGAPQGLPAPIHDFMQHALHLDDHIARLCWTCLKDLAWLDEDVPPHDLTTLIPLFLVHGTELGVGVHELLPPTRTCIVTECPNHPLQRYDGNPPDLREALTRQAVLYTRAHGSVPIYVTSTYCRGCNTRYHHNYFVHRNTRTFYDPEIVPPPIVLQVSTHAFFESALCERFAVQMSMAWTSAQNCAHIYNEEAQAVPWVDKLPVVWPITFDLDSETVSEAFVIHALMTWHWDRGTTLQVPHQAPTQAKRWHAAVQARNAAIAGTGQPHWNHACKRCTRHVLDDAGLIVAAYRSVVTDGVSLGHPCCGVRDCKEPLESSKHRWCARHADSESMCAVVGCLHPVESSFRTCPEPSHRAAEDRFLERSKALFQLKERLKRFGQSDELSQDDHEDTVALDEEGNEISECEMKPPGGHRKVFARFGRRRTHNEELCVGSCGVILGRATFYGAEGPNSVREFWKCLFPTQASLPAVIWFDTNCKVAAMLARDGDTYFDRVALPVDVFHFKSKHKESDKFCGQYCNPALWTELVDEASGKWIFNSSAAEQVNMWFGRFRSMTRLMRSDRYNFFLDEMIMRRNEQVIARLAKAGEAPYSIPRHVLLEDS